MKITEMRSARNGKFFMAGSSDGKIIVFNSETGEKFGPYQTELETISLFMGNSRKYAVFAVCGNDIF